MRREDATAVAWLMGTSALLGAAVYYASPARADDQAAVDRYAGQYGEAICSALDAYPTLPGVLGTSDFVQADGGFTSFEAGEVVGLAVIDYCPRHTELLSLFVSVYAPTMTTPVRGVA